MYIGNKLYIYIRLYKHYLPLTRLLSSLVLSCGVRVLGVENGGVSLCWPGTDTAQEPWAGVGLRTQPSCLAGWEMNSDGHLYLSALLLSWLHWAAWPAFLLEAFASGSLSILAEGQLTCPGAPNSTKPLLQCEGHVPHHI